MCLFMDNITSFKSMVFRAIKAQFLTPYDFAQTFCLDYSNVCKWYRDFRKMPMSLAFDMCDYLGLSVVVFRSV